MPAQNPLQHQRQHDGIYHIGYFVGGKWSQAQEQFDVYNRQPASWSPEWLNPVNKKPKRRLKLPARLSLPGEKRPLNSEQRFYSVGIC